MPPVFDVDKVLKQLLDVRTEKNKKVKLSDDDIKSLCFKSREIFLAQPNLLELESPIKVVGDIHGQFTDLLNIFANGGFPPTVNYLFLGDYVDRGKQSTETICLLLAYKIKYPENFFLLRGNHECETICTTYGFYDECKRRYNTKLFKHFCDVFACLPMAAVIEDKIFCCHGGLSPELKELSQIKNLKRPLHDPISHGLTCDLLWSDPDKNIHGWAESDRGISFTFGEDVLAKFLKKHDFDLVLRAHQVVEDGYEFFGNRKLVTLFSAPNYCEFDNAAALLTIDEELMCTFQILTKREKTK